MTAHVVVAPTCLCRYHGVMARTSTGDMLVSFRIPSDLHQQAAARAEQEDRSLAALIRTALRTYLENK